MLSLICLNSGFVSVSKRAAKWGVLAAAMGLLPVSFHRVQAATPSSAVKPNAHPSQSMPASLKQAWIAARQSEAGQEFAWRPGRGKQPAKISHPQGFEATAHAGQMRVGQSGQPVGMHLAAMQCAGEQRQAFGAHRSAPTLKNRRAEYALKDGVTEWYENGPMGLEQGFTLSKPCQKSAELTLEIALTGVKSVKSTGTDAEPSLQITPKDPAQKPYSYSNLYAEDAQGKALKAKMSGRGEKILLTVNTAQAKFPIVVDPLIGVEQQKLVAIDGVLNDYFATSLAISGDRAVVGSRCSPAYKGVVYVFVRSGDQWIQQQKLEALDGALGDNFCQSVAIAGDTVVVGAAGAGLPPVVSGGSIRLNAGAAYVFVWSGNTWTQKQKLEALDGATGDSFGQSVAITGDTIVVGAYSADLEAKAGVARPNAGAAYVFVKSGAEWTEKKKLVASDGARSDYFGVSVAIAGDTVVVGANSADLTLQPGVSLFEVGAAYVFVKSGAAWNEQKKLVASDGAAGDRFGESVAITGDTVVVGAHYADLAAKAGTPRSDAGAAYVFVRNDTAWTEQQKLVASDGAAIDDFGFSVAITGETIVVGANSADLEPKAGMARSDAGAAYVFVRNGTAWTEHQKLVASDGARRDYFGFAVAIAGDTAVVGAFSADVNGKENAGAVYPFHLVKSGGDACGQGSECLSGLCVDGVCCDSACGGGDSSDCMACSVAKGGAQEGVCGPVLQSAALICRASTGEGDAAELCDGTALTCPEDAPVIPPEASSSGCRCQVGSQSALSFSTWLLPAALLLLTYRRRAS